MFVTINNANQMKKSIQKKDYIITKSKANVKFTSRIVILVVNY